MKLVQLVAKSVVLCGMFFINMFFVAAPLTKTEQQTALIFKSQLARLARELEREQNLDPKLRPKRPVSQSAALKASMANMISELDKLGQKDPASHLQDEARKWQKTISRLLPLPELQKTRPQLQQEQQKREEEKQKEEASAEIIQLLRDEYLAIVEQVRTHGKSIRNGQVVTQIFKKNDIKGNELVVYEDKALDVIKRWFSILPDFDRAKITPLLNFLKDAWAKALFDHEQTVHHGLLSTPRDTTPLSQQFNRRIDACVEAEKEKREQQPKQKQQPEQEQPQGKGEEQENKKEELPQPQLGQQQPGQPSQGQQPQGPQQGYQPQGTGQPGYQQGPAQQGYQPYIPGQPALPPLPAVPNQPSNVHPIQQVDLATLSFDELMKKFSEVQSSKLSENDKTYQENLAFAAAQKEIEALGGSPVTQVENLIGRMKNEYGKMIDAQTPNGIKSWWYSNDIARRKEAFNKRMDAIMGVKAPVQNVKEPQQSAEQSVVNIQQPVKKKTVDEYKKEIKKYIRLLEDETSWDKSNQSVSDQWLSSFIPLYSQAIQAGVKKNIILDYLRNAVIAVINQEKVYDLNKIAKDKNITLDKAQDQAVGEVMEKIESTLPHVVFKTSEQLEQEAKAEQLANLGDEAHKFNALMNSIKSKPEPLSDSKFKQYENNAIVLVREWLTSVDQNKKKDIITFVKQQYQDALQVSHKPGWMEWALGGGIETWVQRFNDRVDAIANGVELQAQPVEGVVMQQDLEKLPIDQFTTNFLAYINTLSKKESWDKKKQSVSDTWKNQFIQYYKTNPYVVNREKDDLLKKVFFDNYDKGDIAPGNRQEAYDALVKEIMP